MRVAATLAFRDAVPFGSFAPRQHHRLHVTRLRQEIIHPAKRAVRRLCKLAGYDIVQP